MNPLQSIRAIVFDAYGTLFHVESLAERLTYHFGEDASLIGPVWRSKQLEYTWLRALMGKYVPFSQITADALRFACKQHEVELKEYIVTDLTKEYYQLVAFDEVANVLNQFKRSFQLAVLSNANPEMLSQALEANQLHSMMDGVYSVDALQTYKPNPQVYQLAVDGLSIPKEEIAFISSNTWDVAGAKSFGFRTIWLNRFEKKAEVLGVSHDAEIASLKDLL